jgi:hypothetical protein
VLLLPCCPTLRHVLLLLLLFPPRLQVLLLHCHYCCQACGS